MSAIRFEWDAAKNRTSLKKHGVTFEEAVTAFADENAIEFYDDEHSEWEDRFLLLGMSALGRVLMVCHCTREQHEVVRIISAWKASIKERRLYGADFQ